jgi:hypothetical protein
VMDRMWREYLVRLAGLAPAGREGSALVQRWTVLGIALYRALRSRGLSHEVACSALRNCLWDGMRVAGLVAWALAWRPGRSRLDRTEHAMRQVRRLFFTGPGFAWREVGLAPGRVGMDCTQCPIARRFEAEGLADVAVHAVCSLDRRLAADWGVRFARTQTIADGGSHCDFRWMAAPTRLKGARRPPPGKLDVNQPEAPREDDS